MSPCGGGVAHAAHPLSFPHLHLPEMSGRCLAKLAANAGYLETDFIYI